MVAKESKNWGRRSKRNEHELVKEILTSLPVSDKHTLELAPDQIPSEPFEEVRTGQDDKQNFSRASHTVIGLFSWVGIFGWTFYIWIASPIALNDLVLALGLWVLTFLFTIIGVPFVRRKARNRAKHD